MTPPRVRHRKEDVRARAEAEFARLDELVRSLGPADWEAPVPRPPGKDPWTVKDALCHVIFWKAHQSRVFRGDRPPDDERGLDVSTLNHKVWLDWRGATPTEVTLWHRRVHAEVLQAIDARDEDWFAGRLRSVWWPGDLESHSADHRVKDVEAALARSEVEAAEAS